MEEVKKCERCFEKKTLDSFYKSQTGAFNRHGYCKKCHLEYKKQTYIPCPIVLLTPAQKAANKKQWYLKNREILLAKEKARYNKLKKEDPARLERYRKNSQPHDNIQRKKRYREDLNFKLTLNLRRRMCKLIKRGDRKGSAVKDLGCDFDFFIQYIEAKFTEGMTWQNYGKWHLDHIYPLSRVDLTNREEFLKVSHYSNYQPLWAKDNISKSNKIRSI